MTPASRSTSPRPDHLCRAHDHWTPEYQPQGFQQAGPSASRTLSSSRWPHQLSALAASTNPHAAAQFRSHHAAPASRLDATGTSGTASAVASPGATEPYGSGFARRGLHRYLMPLADALGLSVVEETGHPQGVWIFADLAKSFGIDITQRDLQSWSLQFTVSRALDTLVDEDNVQDIRPHVEQLAAGLPVKGVSTAEAAAFAAAYASWTETMRSGLRAGAQLGAFAKQHLNAANIAQFIASRCEEADVFAGIFSIEVSDSAPDREARIAFNLWLRQFSRASYLLDNLVDLRSDHAQGLVSLRPSLSHHAALGRAVVTELRRCMRTLPPGAAARLFLAGVSKTLRDAADLPPTDRRAYSSFSSLPSEAPDNLPTAALPQRFIEQLAANEQPLRDRPRLAHSLDRALANMDRRLRHNALRIRLARLRGNDPAWPGVPQMPAWRASNVETMRRAAGIDSTAEPPFAVNVRSLSGKPVILVRNDLMLAGDTRMQEGTLTHALGHALMDERFRDLAERLGTTEGAASWLGTLAYHAPAVHERTYRSLLAARTLAAAARGIASDDIHFEDLGALYPLEATDVERIAEHIGLRTALRAALHGDPAALECFAQAARAFRRDDV